VGGDRSVGGRGIERKKTGGEIDPIQSNTLESLGLIGKKGRKKKKKIQHLWGPINKGGGGWGVGLLGGQAWKEQMKEQGGILLLSEYDKSGRTQNRWEGWSTFRRGKRIWE